MINFEINKIQEEDLSVIKSLFVEYEKQLGVDLCFQNFENELAELPGIYKEPKGTILKLVIERKIVGVVALKPLSQTECEMKRLYIQDDFKGFGLGEKLAQKIMSIAKEKGYKTIKLDTLARLAPAVKLYQKLNFKETKPYNFNPENDILYFEKEL